MGDAVSEAEAVVRKYAQDKQIKALMGGLVQALCESRPSDVVGFAHTWLGERKNEAPGHRGDPKLHSLVQQIRDERAKRSDVRKDEEGMEEDREVLLALKRKQSRQLLAASEQNGVAMPGIMLEAAPIILE